MNVPYLNRYRNGEYLQYMKDVLQLTNDAAIDNLTPLTTTLSPLVASIDAAFQQSQGSVLTQDIITLDQRRDQAIVGLRSVTEGYKSHYDTAVVNAATTLHNNIASHGSKIQQLSYQEETAVLDSIITDWETESELQAAITVLNLTDWLAELKNANTAFVTKYLERVEETAANPSENIPIIRGQATEAYRNLIAHIDAHTTLATAEGYSILQSQLSVLAGQYNQVVDNRSSTTTSEPTSEDTEDAQA